MMRTIPEDICLEMSDAFEGKDKNFTLYTSIVNKKEYGKEEKNFYPVFEDDLRDESLDTEVLLEQLKVNKVRLYTFFLRADYHTTRKLAERKRLFRGKVVTKNSDYTIKVQVLQNQNYINKLKEMFAVCKQNQLIWRTPCAPSFFKMFDVFIVETDLPWYEEIISVDINFEEYSQLIQKDIIPVWNLELIKLTPDIRPVYDEILQQYHYVINRRRMREDSQYLLADNNVEITKCYIESGLHFYCKEKREQSWTLYRVANSIADEDPEHIFHNYMRNINLHPTRTYAGVIRLVNELGYKDRFELRRVEVADKECENDVYRINEIWEELRRYPRERRYMKLIFKSKQNDYLQMDVLSYLVSEIQRQYPEYCCVAELI